MGYDIEWSVKMEWDEKDRLYAVSELEDFGGILVKNGYPVTDNAELNEMLPKVANCIPMAIDLDSKTEQEQEEYFERCRRYELFKFAVNACYC